MPDVHCGKPTNPTVLSQIYCSPLVSSLRLRREEGFVCMVLGLRTRTVERVGDDYARLVTLSHPTLRPQVGPADIQRYSPHSVDVIDLKAFSTAIGLFFGIYPANRAASLNAIDALRYEQRRRMKADR